METRCFKREGSMKLSSITSSHAQFSPERNIATTTLRIFCRGAGSFGRLLMNISWR